MKLRTTRDQHKGLLVGVSFTFAEALRRDPKVKKHWLGLVDGNADQIAHFESLGVAYGVDQTIILDFIHVAGYVWKAGFALFGRGTADAATWVCERLAEILRGKSSLVAAGMRRSATNRGLDDQQRKPIDECADYLLNHTPYLRYDQYLAAGYPISTATRIAALKEELKARRTERILKIP